MQPSFNRNPRSLKEWWTLLGRSIYTGDRLRANLAALTMVSIVTAMLGALLVIVNLLPGSGSVNPSRLVMSVVTLLAGLGCAWLSHWRKNRQAAILIPTLFCCVVFTFYALTGYAEGTGILWSLLLPIGMSYFVGVQYGIILSVYYSVLYMVVFYTPLGRNLGLYYTDSFMVRFPIMFLFLSLFTAVAMIQYHRIALLEMDYTDRLNEEVRKQTAVAEERSRRIEQLSIQTIQTLANAIDAKDPYTRGHSTRVSQYSVMIAESLGWNRDRVENLRCAALLHDIGKIGVPDSILNKPRRLTDLEYDMIKSHTTMGGEILRDRIIIRIAEDVALSHHERYDGRGYPRGLKGEEISEESRIVAIADAFDAMNSNRVYRSACNPEHILRELTDGKGKQFDPRFADVFIGLWQQGRLDEIIREGEPETVQNTGDASSLLREVIDSYRSANPADSLDIITGIPDRTSGETAIAGSMKETAGCLVFFDMDNLKKINDTGGHQAGDKILRIMGDVLKEASGDKICCRLGGDEFLMFLKNVSETEAEASVRGLIRSFEEKKSEDPALAPASLSAGLVMSSPADSYTVTFNKADKALYHVKQNGKNSYSFYRDEEDTFRHEKADLHKLVAGIRNSGSYNGAMDVEYRQFTRLYEFILNLEERFHQTYRLVMITLEAPEGEEPVLEKVESSMYCMEQAVRQNIRNVDVLTRYSRQQILVILLGTDEEGVRVAMERIFRVYFRMSGADSLSPSYEVADM